MLNRRNFLKGLFASVAAAALVKNGVVQPKKVLAEPERWTIDMGANTRRREWAVMRHIWNGHLGHVAVWDRELSAAEITRLTEVPDHVNCRCVIVPYLHKWPSLNWNNRHQWIDDRIVQFDQMKLYIPKHVNDSIIAQAFADIKATLPWPYYGGPAITPTEVQARIDELARDRAQPRGILGPDGIAELWRQA